MHKTCVVIAGAVLALLCGAAQAANRCTMPDGKVVYQDTPCAGGGERVNLSGAGQAQTQAPGSTYYKREAGRLARQERMESAILNREIVIGMSADEAIRAWGRPSKVNSTIRSGGQSEQWVYRRGRGAAQYVYVDNGVVTTVQTSE